MRELENICAFALPLEYSFKREYLCLKKMYSKCDSPNYSVCPSNPANIGYGEVWSEREEKKK